MAAGELVDAPPAEESGLAAAAAEPAAATAEQGGNVPPCLLDGSAIAMLFLKMDDTGDEAASKAAKLAFSKCVNASEDTVWCGRTYGG